MKDTQYSSLLRRRWWVSGRTGCPECVLRLPSHPYLLLKYSHCSVKINLCALLVWNYCLLLLSSQAFLKKRLHPLLEIRLHNKPICWRIQNAWGSIALPHPAFRDSWDLSDSVYQRRLPWRARSAWICGWHADWPPCSRHCSGRYHTGFLLLESWFALHCLHRSSRRWWGREWWKTTGSDLQFTFWNGCSSICYCTADFTDLFGSLSAFRTIDDKTIRAETQLA